MALHMIREWQYLAISKKILDQYQDNSLLEKIINKFNDSRIQTESLANYSLFSFRIGKKERVICKSDRYQNQDCLIIVDILENHEYNALQNNPRVHHNYDVLLPDNVQEFISKKNKLKQNLAILVASTQEALINNTLTKELPILPRASRTNFDNKTIIFSNEQHKILNSINEDAGIFKITGTAGSGKTLLAALLLSNTLIKDDDHRSLYVTKSEKLVNEINKQLHNLLSEDSNKDILTHIDIRTYDDFCKDLGFKNTRSNLEDFTTWIQDKQEFIKYIQKLKGKKQNNDYIIAKEIYEDIRKLHDNGESIGKKQSYGHYISRNILNLYQKYLKENNKSNLELLNTDDINNHTLYNHIIVDEAQDFGKSTLKIIMSCLNKDIATNKTTGNMYLFMDTNQSLLDDFNLVSSYIKELSKYNNMKLSDYILTYNYRSPQSIINLASNVINIKNVIIGGTLNKSFKPIIELKDNHSNQDDTGYIKWINRDNTVNVDIQDQEIFNNLKKEISHSIEAALIIPDKALFNTASHMFTDALVFTPEEIRGLEFKKVILFNFISGKYPNNIITEKELKNVSLLKDKTQHNFPKDIQQAKAGGKHSKFFNNLFVGITRSTNSVYFVETEGEKSKAFEELLNTNSYTGEDIILGSSSLLEKFTKLEEISCAELSSDVIEQYLQKIYTHVKNNNIPQNEINEISLKFQKFLTNIVSSSNIANQILDWFKTISSEHPVSVIPSPLDINKHNKFSKVRSNQHKKEEDVSLKLRQETAGGNISLTVSIHDIFSMDIKSLICESQLESICDDHNQSTTLCILTQTLPTQTKLLQYIQDNGHELLSTNISVKALNYYNKQNISALYNLLNNKNLELLFKRLIQDKNFVKKITPEGLYRVGPSNFSPIYYIHQKLNFKEYKLLYTHINKISNSKLDIYEIYDFSKGNIPLDTSDHKLDSNTLLGITKKKTIRPLHVAALRADINSIKALLKHGADVNVKSILEKFTPLYIATQKKHVNAIKTLLAYGADTNHPNKDNITPLYIATQNKDIESMKLLIKNGAQVNTKTNKQVTPLHIAVEKGYVEAIKLLIENGAQVNVKTDEGMTPLYVAAYKEQIEAIKLLIENGAQVDAKTNKEDTPLHIAAEKGDVKAIKLLIKNGAQVNTKTIEGATPLHFAAQEGHVEATKLLIKNGAQVNANTIEGATPLHLAEENRHIDTMEFLNKIQNNSVNNTSFCHKLTFSNSSFSVSR